jgi:DDE superfamily endonuclease
MWCIPPQQNAAFVARMEALLNLYQRPYNPLEPVLCMDESLKELQIATYFPLQTRPGRPARFDYLYKPVGASTLLLCVEPLRGWRYVQVRDHRKFEDWAYFMRQVLTDFYPHATTVHLVVDNLNIHTSAAFYKTFPAADAKRLSDRITFHYTPVHGSWLNMAEIEFGVLKRQCLSQRFASRELLTPAVQAWFEARNLLAPQINWQFTVADARVKLRHLYPSFDA